MNGERVGSAQLHSLWQRLSGRDVAVLHSLDEHRFLTTSQLQRLHFAGHRSALAAIRACVRVLDRLRQLRLITRLHRRIGGLHAGSRAFVWCLDAVGDRIVRHDAERPTRRRFFEPTPLFLEHTLAVAELRVQLEEAARAGLLELEQVQTEPAAWRGYVSPSGAPAMLKPDLALVTALGDYEDHWFIEVDRGTESIRTVLAKCGQYEAYRRSGREQAERGIFPLVVWVVPDAKRRARIEAELHATRGVDTALFRLAAPGSVVALITGLAPPDEAETTPDATQLKKGGTP